MDLNPGKLYEVIAELPLYQENNNQQRLARSGELLLLLEIKFDERNPKLKQLVFLYKEMICYRMFWAPNIHNDLSDYERE